MEETNFHPLLSEVEVNETDGLDGTIVIIFFSKKNDKIYILADGRGTIETSYGVTHVVRSNASKILSFRDCLVTFTGRSTHCRVLFGKMRKWFEEGSSVTQAILKANEQIQSDQEVNLANIGVLGFHDTGVYMEVAGRTRQKIVGMNYELLCCGSGSPYAREQFRKIDCDFETDEEILDALYRSVAAACILDPKCGGLITSSSVKRGEPVKISNRRLHCIRLIHHYYTYMEMYFDSSLLLLTTGILTDEPPRIAQGIQLLYPMLKINALGGHGDHMMIWNLCFDSKADLELAREKDAEGSNIDIKLQKLFQKLEREMSNLRLTTDYKFELLVPSEATFRMLRENYFNLCQNNIF
ncbi:hypothetical protein OROGR_020090 [Orobanche gracilis]